MKERPVFPLLLSMALPMVLSMLVNALYNIVDSLFVAKIGEEAIAALSLVFPMQNFINAVAIGFGVGVNATVAFHLGAEEPKKANIAATCGLLLSILHGIVLAVGCIALAPAFLGMFTQNVRVASQGVCYATIVFSFAGILSLSLFFEKVFQAEGRMNVTMLGLLCGCVTNIILDPLLIFGIGFLPEMGIAGAAVATGLGQVVTLAVFLVVYIAMPGRVRICRPVWHGMGTIVRRLYGIGIPAMLNMALPSLLVSVLNTILVSFSQAYVVVLGVYYKLQTFLYLPASGIVQGMRPVIGFNYGAGETRRVRRIFLVSLAMIGAMMVVGTLLCQLLPEQLIRLFSDNPETVTAGRTALRMISAGFIVSAVSVTASGALEGMGKGLPSFLISLLRYTVILIPLALVLSKWLGAAGVWHAFWIAETLSAAAAFLIYRNAAPRAG